MNNYIESLNWRYATKKFDSNRIISDEDLQILLDATRLSASSFGLQPYHVFVVTNKELRTQLKSASSGQSQITDSSHVLVFASKTSFGTELIDNYLKEVSKTREIPMEDLQGYGDFMKSKLVDLPDTAKEGWAAKQTYLADQSI